jgi:hypothetical protein
MVRNSTPAMANLWAARGKCEGENTRYATARRVHIEVKSMKPTLAGVQTYSLITGFVSGIQKLRSSQHIRYALRPSTMIEKTTCTPRRPRMIAGATILLDTGMCGDGCRVYS